MKAPIRISRSAQSLGLAVLFSCAIYSCDNARPKVAPPIHSCEILTIAEVEGLLDATVERPPTETHNVQQDLSHWMSMCNYYAPDSGISVGFMIKPFPRNHQNPDAAYEAYTKELKNEAPDLSIQPVQGIAGRAFWTVETGQLTVFSNSHMYIFSARSKGSTDPENPDLARKIATAVLAK